MSKNDHHKVDFSVCCQSDLNDIDSWNECKEEGGKYLLSNLLEIHLSFKHYRCETLANYLDDSLATSFRLSSSPQSNTRSNFDSFYKAEPGSHSQLIQSVPSSPPNENTASLCQSETSKLLPHSKSSLKQIRFNANDFHILISKISRFRKLNFDSTRAKLSCLHLSHKKTGKKCNPTAPCNSYEQICSDTKVEASTKSKIFVTPELAHSTSIEPSSICQEWNLYGKHNIEIEAYLSPNPVNISQNQTTSDRNPLVESQFDHIPNTQTKHSCSLSFSNISSYSSQPQKTQPQIPLSISRGSSFKPSQLDFRSISEYSFTKNGLSHKIKADVCSLPTCMDNEMSSHMLESNSHFSGPQNRMPSYVSISRAISGYADYNKYCSDLKRDNSLLDSFALPSKNSSNVNGDHAQFIKPNAPSVSDQVDNFCSLPYEPTHEKICLDNASKSFLQTKIESLYGESFAENWKKSRVKSNSPKSSNSVEKTRSPSCPPSRIASEEVNNLIKSFHKINSLDNSRGSPDSSQTNCIEFNGNRILSKSSDINFEATTSGQKDGHWFLTQLNQCTSQLRVHIERYERILEDFIGIPDEIVGKIRTTIGKANLLINKKLHQFNQLCRDSIIQREDQEFKINSDDLRGFWDMVLIQVEEVNNAFKELDWSKDNNWQDDEGVLKTSARKLSNSKHNINSPRSFSKLVSPKNSPKKDKTASPNGLDRENERKNRLLEIKRKGKMKARENTEEEITIFVPTADLDLEK